MPQKQGAARSAAEQRAKFEETARALGCDEDEAAFDEKLKKLVPPKTAPTDDPGPAPGLSASGRASPPKRRG